MDVVTQGTNAIILQTLQFGGQASRGVYPADVGHGPWWVLGLLVLGLLIPGGWYVWGMVFHRPKPHKDKQ